MATKEGGKSNFRFQVLREWREFDGKGQDSRRKLSTRDSSERSGRLKFLEEAAVRARSEEPLE